MNSEAITGNRILYEHACMFISDLKKKIVKKFCIYCLLGYEIYIHVLYINHQFKKKKMSIHSS